MVTVVRNERGKQLKTLDKAVCISLSTNTLEKGINPTILSPAMVQL